MNPKFSLALVVVFFLSIPAIQSYAREPWLSEVSKGWKKLPTAKSLPGFCGTNPNPKYKNVNWKKIYGESIIWTNHYCASKAQMYICYRYEKDQKRQCLDYLARGMRYSINNVKNPKFKLYPLLYTDYGKLLGDAGHFEQAIKQFKNAIKKNRKYLPAYVGLADVYIQAGQLDYAEIVVKSGLKIKKTKGFARRLKTIRNMKEKQ